MKNQKIEIFTFEQNEIRILTIAGKEPVFVAREIERLLGYDSKNATKLSYIRYNRYSVFNQDGGQISELDCLSESDVGQLVSASKYEDKAKRFGKWLQEEVLISLSNTNDFEVIDVNDLKKNQVEVTKIATVTVAAVAAAKAFGFADKDVFSYADSAVKAITGISPLILMEESVRNEEKFLTAASLGKRIGISTAAMNLKLAQLGLQRRKWQYDSWLLTPLGKKYGVSFDAKTNESSRGGIDQKIIWKEDAILSFLANRFVPLNPVTAQLPLAPEKSDPIIFKIAATPNASTVNTTVDDPVWDF
jgi:prophage antirepressor-like protein